MCDQPASPRWPGDSGARRARRWGLSAEEAPKASGTERIHDFPLCADSGAMPQLLGGQKQPGSCGILHKHRRSRRRCSLARGSEAEAASCSTTATTVVAVMTAATTTVVETTEKAATAARRLPVMTTDVAAAARGGPPGVGLEATALVVSASPAEPVREAMVAGRATGTEPAEPLASSKVAREAGSPAAGEEPRGVGEAAPIPGPSLAMGMETEQAPARSASARATQLWKVLPAGCRISSIGAATRSLPPRWMVRFPPMAAPRSRTRA